MNLSLLPFILAIMSLSSSYKVPSDHKIATFKAEKIGEIPVSDVKEKYRGTAGAFSGIVGNKLIVAGGTNFPDKKPWEGGTKIFLDKIYLFNLKEDNLEPVNHTCILEEPIAYGASISLPNGVLCIGGNGSVACSSNVFIIRWNESAQNLYIEKYPDLPVLLSYSTAVLIDHFVYVAGGSSSPDGKETNNFFFRLDISPLNLESFRWEQLPPYPGKSRILGVSAAQSDSHRKCLYLFGGRNTNDPENPAVFTDGLVYSPDTRTWDQVRTNPPSVFQVMAGSAFSSGSDEIVFIGGASDSTFLKEQHLKAELAHSVAQKNDANSTRIKEKLLQFYEGHTGFSSGILVYNTITHAVTDAGNFGSLCPVTTNAIPYGDGAIVPCGEIKPGIRTPDIYRISKE